MSNNIPLIPEVPIEIKDAVNNGTLAVFIGAGVSRLLEPDGCDGWDTLARKLVIRCYKEKILSFRDHEILSQNSDHKKTITICYNQFKNNNLEDVFYEVMNIALKEGADIKSPNIYNHIIRLRGLFITTNADTHFDKFFYTPNIIYDKSDFRPDKLDSTKLYHIHGSVGDGSIRRNSLVFTVPEYMKRYIDKEFRSFLTEIFLKYTVLFLGYGAAEFEMLTFIIQNTSINPLVPKHFMLFPCYSSDGNILRYDQQYYKDLNINIVPYTKDKNGYKQLTEVMENWNNEINQSTGYLHSSSRLIDEAVE